MGRARRNLVALGLLTFILPSCNSSFANQISSQRLRDALDIKPIVKELVAPEAPPEPPEAEIVEEPQTPAPDPGPAYWTCPTCSPIEQRILRAFQDEGITDQVALAVLMGNIRQESKFKPTICEGGKLTGYHGCRRGGFGLIQWTTWGRYAGLGRTAKAYQLNPNSVEAQMKWLFAETEWKKVSWMFKAKGKPMSFYMDAAYKWLRWGKKGARTYYSQNYANKLELN